jgi:hypothetical protein
MSHYHEQWQQETAAARLWAATVEAGATYRDEDVPVERAEVLRGLHARGLEIEPACEGLAWTVTVKETTT